MRAQNASAGNVPQDTSTGAPPSNNATSDSNGQRTSTETGTTNALEDSASNAKEPMNEKDVDYKKLEEMTAMADGKGHSTEKEAGSRNNSGTEAVQPNEGLGDA